MKLTYITRTLIPSKAAQSIQIEAMARAFHAQLGNNFKLISGAGEDWAEMEAPFQWKRRLSSCHHWIRYFFMALEACLGTVLNRKRVVFTRDIGIAWAVIAFGGRAVFEAHKQPVGRVAPWLMRRLVGTKKFQMVTISKALMDFYLDKYKAERKQILVAHDGVDYEKYIQAGKQSEHGIRDLFGFDHKGIVVLHTGSLYKGGLEIFSLLAKQLGNKGIFVHVGGTTDEVNSLQKQMDVDGCSNVKIFSYQPIEEIRKMQMSSDLLFYITTKESPIYWCTSPLKLFEYMATGNPILGARIGSIGEVIDDSNAFCFNPDKPDTLKSALKLYMDNPKEAKLRAANALRQAKELYSWERRVEKIISFSIDCEKDVLTALGKGNHL